MAQLKTDENLGRRVAARLRAAGHDVHTALDEGLGGHPDTHVWATCRAEARCLITLDTDFADIRWFEPSGSAGVILLRPQDPDLTHLMPLLDLVLRLLEDDVAGHLWIVTEDRIRVR